MHKNEITQFFDYNSYTYNKDSVLGVYLIHGFSSTTYEVKKLAEHLSTFGYYVKANNLPGHGTSIDDCNLTKYNEWITFVEKDIAEMYTKCNKVIVMGVSMGALLTLNLATVFPLDGIVLGGCLLEFKNEFNVRIMVRLLNKIKPKVPKQTQFKNKDSKHIHFYGYNQYPLIALNEMRKLLDKVNKKLDKVKCHTLLIHSQDDKTALFKNHNLLKNSMINAKIDCLVLENAGHHIFDPDKDNQDIIFKKITQFSKKVFSE